MSKSAYKHYGLDVYEADGGHEYAVGTDKQADKAAREYVRETLWAFRTSFLARFVPEGVGEDILSIVQEKCESSNEAIARLVGDKLGDLIDEAIQSDGRGHLLSPYDGNEIDSDDIDGLPSGKVAYRLN